MTLPPQAAHSPATPQPIPGAALANQAVDSLRGYAYQALATALAWIDLPDRATLYLEVAEDYALVANQALEIVQVKDTHKTGTLTLNTAAVAGVVARFISIVQANPSADARLRYLTTSEIGVERHPIQPGSSESGIRYWRRCAAGASVQPLRDVLTGTKFSREVRTFCIDRDDEALRRDLIQRIHWDCGQPSFTPLRQDLEDRLVVICRDHFGVPSFAASSLTDVLLARVITTSIHPDPSIRTLTRAALYRELDHATLVPVSRFSLHSARALNLVPGSPSRDISTPLGSLSVSDPTWIVHHPTALAQGRLVDRPHLQVAITTALHNYGLCFLAGSSGVGKSTVARVVTANATQLSHTADFRHASAKDASRRLSTLFHHLSRLGPGTLILEDLNVLHEPHVRLQLWRVVGAMRRSDIGAIVTCHHRPSAPALHDMGLSPTSVVLCRYFSRSETRALVEEYGGDSSVWGDVAHAFGGGGHPQLVHAYVNDIAHRGWPAAETRSVERRIAVSPTIDAVSVEVRRRVKSGLRADVREFLYRLSVASVHFNRATALAVASISSSSRAPGELLDQLIGPWIESVGPDRFRISPLAQAAGKGMLSPPEEERVHESVAAETLRTGHLILDDLNALFSHALKGRSDDSLFRLGFSVFAASKEMSSRLSAHFSDLRDWPAEVEFPAAGTAASAMLRLAQLRLLTEANTDQDLTAIVDTALKATAGIQEGSLRAALEAWTLATVLTSPSVANRVTNWILLLLRAEKALKTNELLAGWANSVQTSPDLAGARFLTVLFAIGAVHINTVRRLESVIEELDELDKPRRDLLLAPRQEETSYYSLVIGGAGISEAQNDAFQPEDAIARYGRMADRTRRWNMPTLSAHCSAAQAGLLDQYGHLKDEALCVLDDARLVLGSQVPLLRARAGLHFAHREYKNALHSFREVMPELRGYHPFERAVVAREAAVSAARCEEWDEAERWFDEAKAAVQLRGTTATKVSAAALEADAAGSALMAGASARAISRFARALTDITSGDLEDTLETAHCSRVVRHAVMWCFATVARKELKGSDGKPLTFLPGQCSNPTPNPAIRDHPLGPGDVGWYMLARAEIIAGVDVGVTTGLNKRLTGERIPFLECTLRWQQMAASIERVDADGVANQLIRYLEASVYLKRNKDRLRDAWNALEPGRGEIPELSTTAMRSAFVIGAARGCVVGFAICGVFARQNDALTNMLGKLEQRHKALARDWSLLDNSGTGSFLNDGLAQSILDSIEVYGRKDKVEPEFFWGMSFALVRWISKSDFQEVLVGPLGCWLRKEWKRIVTEERDQLCMPELTVPPICDVLDTPAEARGFAVDLLRVTLDGSVKAGRERYRKALSQMTED